MGVDVTDTEQIKNAVARAVELGPLRVLVNSAGIGWAQRTIGRDGEFDSAHDLAAFSKVIAINLIGTFDTLRLAATAMSKNEPNPNGERGAVVNMASEAAFDGQIGQASYSASKGGVVGMTLPVARDLAAVGIRVNTVAPGLIDTRSTARVRLLSSSRPSSGRVSCSRSVSVSRTSWPAWSSSASPTPT